VAAELITLPFRPVINLQGGLESGALLDVFESGTTTRVTVYSDSGLTTPLSNPVEANSLGVFPAVYYDDTQAIRVRVKEADGTVLSDTDPYYTDFGSVQAAADAASADATAAGVSAAAAAASAVAADVSADAAAASAASAANAPGTSATSATSLTIGTGSRSFTIETGKAFVVGQFVTIASTASPTNLMFGNITAHNSGTGAMTVEVTATLGSGTLSAWTIALSGARGAAGAGSGTVTSVGGTGTVNGLTLTGTVTTSGNLTLGGTLSGVNLASAVTGTLPVANGGTGATDAATARSNLSAAASGSNTDITSLRQSVNIAATGTISPDHIGYRGLPQNSQTSGYTLVLADSGKHISITTGGIAIPANGTTAFPVGTVIAVYNDSASTQSITITTDTLRLAGTASTGTRTLAGRGLATLVKVKSTEWIASGNVT
jgi:hypothetical protein